MQGQKGEWEVKVELSKLPENYTVYCDVLLPGRKSNIDFIVTGPTGVFVLEVKSHKGNISSKFIYDQYYQQVLKSTMLIRDYLWQRTADDIFVKAVLVYSSDEAKVRTAETDKHVTVIHKSNLNKFILSQRDISKTNQILEYDRHLAPLVVHNLG